MSRTTPSHIVPVAHPLFFILRIVQLVLAVILLGLLSYLAWVYNNAVSSFTSVYSGAIGVGIFSVVLTIALGVYYLVSTMAVHNIYNKWAVIGLEAAATLFWLITFALVADCVSGVVASSKASNYTYSYCDDYGYCYRRLGKRDTLGTWNAIWYTSLAFSLIEWILFVATLVLLALALHKHRGSDSAAAPAVATEHNTTPKQMEAGPAPEYQQPQAVPQPQTTHEQQPASQPMQQHPVQEQQPMH